MYTDLHFNIILLNSGISGIFLSYKNSHLEFYNETLNAPDTTLARIT